MIDKIFDGFVFAIQCWLTDEVTHDSKSKKESTGKEETIPENKTDIIADLPEEP